VRTVSTELTRGEMFRKRMSSKIKIVMGMKLIRIWIIPVFWKTVERLRILRRKRRRGERIVREDRLSKIHLSWETSKVCGRRRISCWVPDVVSRVR